MKLYQAKKELERYEDVRGYIQNLLPPGVVIRSVLLCTGKRGAVRGNHHHIKDVHYCYVLSGAIRYFYQTTPLSFLKNIDLKVGDMVESPAGEYHKFVFLERGAFIAMAKEPRLQKNYESDTVRRD